MMNYSQFSLDSNFLQYTVLIFLLYKIVVFSSDKINIKIFWLEY